MYYCSNQNPFIIYYLRFSFCLIFRCVVDLFILTVCSVNFTFPVRLGSLRAGTVVLRLDCRLQHLKLGTPCTGRSPHMCCIGGIPRLETGLMGPSSVCVRETLQTAPIPWAGNSCEIRVVNGVCGLKGLWRLQSWKLPPFADSVISKRPAHPGVLS